MKLGWRYPDALWDVLEGKTPALEGEETEPHPVERLRLKSWKWSGRLIKHKSFAEVGVIHELRSFSALTSISLIYIDALVDKHGIHDGSVEKYVAKLLSSLQELRDIKLDCCTVVNPNFISLLSASASHLRLRELRFLHCPFLEDSYVSSDPGSGLTSFLQQPQCRSLKVLEVKSCQACSLGFITALSCTPILEHLSFDGRISNGIFNPLHPRYHTLLSLSASARIRWPSTLQSLTASSLREWSSAECIAFLTSLVEAAPTMARLSRIRIWCVTDIDWRGRAEFRKQWTDVVAAAFSNAEIVQMRFDNARPAEQLWKETDFLEESAVLGRVRKRGVGARRRGGGGGGGRRNRARAGGAGGSESEGDEDYNDD